MKDILVLGGGPAGCVSALHLSRMGYSVTLVSQRLPGVRVEGLSARVVAGLRNAGCLRAVAQIGAPVPRVATWNGHESDANQEYVLDRAKFDAALLEDARSGGVAAIDGKVVETVARPEGWRIRLAHFQEGAEELHGRFLIEARGRRAPRARSVDLRGPPALSLSRGYLGCPRDVAGTRIASFSEGWVWFASTGEGAGTVQIIVSGDGDTRLRAADPGAVFDRLLAAVEDVRDWIGADAVPAGPVAIRDATAFRHRSPVGERSLRVGDAAFGMDPLSGHGIFEAVGGAMAAAPVVNTLLSRPEAAPLARDFYACRVRDAFVRHARVGRDFYRAEQRWKDRRFWRARVDWPDGEPTHGTPGEPLPQVRRVSVIEDDFIERRDVLVTRDHPRGVRFVDGVPLVALIDLIDRLSRMPNRDETATGLGSAGENYTVAANWLRHQGVLTGDGCLKVSAARLRENDTAS